MAGEEDAFFDHELAIHFLRSGLIDLYCHKLHHDPPWLSETVYLAKID